MAEISPATSSASVARLRVEFSVFFLLVPVVIAVALPPSWMFPLLFAFTAVGVVLLAITPGFRWRELLEGASRMSLPLVAGVVAGTLALGAAIMLATRPEALGWLIRYNPQLMLAIALAYPILSALPQELVFRPLFFRRYGAILPGSDTVAVWLNATIFSLAHLMYWSWIVAGMTFVGGLVFAYSYRIRRNFPEAVLAHSLAGVAVFALGLGVYFYSGNVTRPF